MRNIVLKVLGLGFAWALSLDLLYLYCSGAWFDPIKVIEYSEVVLLIIINLGSFILLVNELFDLREVKVC